MGHKMSNRFTAATRMIALLAFFLVLPALGRADFLLPKELADNVEVISTFDLKQVVTPVEKAAYAEQRHVYGNLVGNALKAEGKGGVYEGKVLKVRKAFPIYRVYSQRVNPQTGRNNRFGGWWTHVPPGMGITRADYRRRYEICESFNPELDRVVQCQAYPDALLVIGPGQSVNEELCGKRNESYAADAGKDYLQIFIFDMYKHSFPLRDALPLQQDAERYVGCPDETGDLPFESYTGGPAR